MKKSVWGPIIWTFLHNLTIKIKPEMFAHERETLIEFIGKICEHLPCPYCASHAREYLKTKRFNNVQTQEQMIRFMFNLHNDANKRLRKPEFSFDDLNPKYGPINFEESAINYFKLFNRSYYNERMFLNTYRRKEFVKQFVNYTKNNLYKFDNIISATS
jgi:hypothetical protein